MSSSDRQIINSDCIIIGGNITGLITASILQRRGIKATVIEEAGQVGGQLVTRQVTGTDNIKGVFDYGTQYFDVETPEFQIWVNEWLGNKVIRKWSDGFDQTDLRPCYCGRNGMQDVAEYLGKDLNISTNTKVVDVSYEKKWSIETQNSQVYQGDMLVMASPIPKSLSLLDASFIALPLELRFALEKIEYGKRITVLALLENPSSIAAPGGINIKTDALSWLGDNHQKGISPNGYAVTIHASHKFSDEYWDSDDAEIIYKLITAAADYLGSSVIKYEIHRWNYDLPQSAYNESCLTLSELPLVLAGDAFVAPTIEGAVTSGIAAGDLISQRFGVRI